MIFLSEWIPPTLDKNLVQRLMDSMARKVLVMNHPPNRPMCDCLGIEEFAIEQLRQKGETD